jgi:hypothetical protein
VAGNEEGDCKGGKGNGNSNKVVGNKESNCEHHFNMCITMIIYQCARWRKTYILRWFATTHAVTSA